MSGHRPTRAQRAAILDRRIRKARARHHIREVFARRRAARRRLALFPGLFG